MLASKYSLKGTKSFSRVEKEGKIYQSDSFGIAYFDRNDKELPLFGFIVSNKISNDSTTRNRAKRAMKEAIRFTYFDVKPGFDVVFLAKQSILRQSTENIMKEVRVAMKGANLYK
jgi:ribonuclease P protein component